MAEKVLNNLVEYYWQGGCTPTAVGMVVGYWDRKGYDNLIPGDSSTFSQNVKNAIASPEHFQSYAEPKEDTYRTSYNINIKPDKSQLGGAHANNSIADFLETSRSSKGLAYGWTSAGMEGVGFSRYAQYKGYNFSNVYRTWGNFSFENVAYEIDNNRPVIFSVDSTGDGINDHNIMVVGYDRTTQRFAFHDGFRTTTNILWEDFSGPKAGNKWGITSATFIRPNGSSRFSRLSRNNLTSVLTGPNLATEETQTTEVKVMNDKDIVTGTEAFAPLTGVYNQPQTVKNSFSVSEDSFPPSSMPLENSILGSENNNKDTMVSDNDRGQWYGVDVNFNQDFNFL